jgi:hypothetical protein
MPPKKEKRSTLKLFEVFKDKESEEITREEFKGIITDLKPVMDAKDREVERLRSYYESSRLLDAKIELERAFRNISENLGISSIPLEINLEFPPIDDSGSHSPVSLPVELGNSRYLKDAYRRRAKTIFNNVLKLYDAEEAGAIPFFLKHPEKLNSEHLKTEERSYLIKNLFKLELHVLIEAVKFLEDEIRKKSEARPHYYKKYIEGYQSWMGNIGWGGGAGKLGVDQFIQDWKKAYRKVQRDYKLGEEFNHPIGGRDHKAELQMSWNGESLEDVLCKPNVSRLVDFFVARYPDNNELFRVVFPFTHASAKAIDAHLRGVPYVEGG